jgi:hypothetical protein
MLTLIGSNTEDPQKCSDGPSPLFKNDDTAPTRTESKSPITFPNLIQRVGTAKSAWTMNQIQIEEFPDQQVSP